MASPWGRRLRPLAVLCALVLVFWGVASAGSLIAQIVELNEYGWPDENADGEVWAWIWLYLLAASSGCWVGLWGLFGLGWRPPLHLGILALFVAVGLEVGANLVQANYVAQLDRSWSFADQLGWYGDRITFQADGLTGDRETTGFFIALPLVTAWLPLAAWFVVVVSGAGRKVQPQYGAPAYPQYGYQQPAYQQPAYQQPAYQQPAYQQPVYQQPPPVAYQPAPAYQPPPVRQERVPWQQVPPVVPPARPAAPPPKPPDQQDTLPYPNHPGGG
jgi:hypothetical protein